MKNLIILTLSLLVIGITVGCSTLGGAAIGGFTGSLWGDARTGAAVGATVGAIDDMFGY